MRVFIFKCVGCLRARWSVSGAEVRAIEASRSCRSSSAAPSAAGSRHVAGPRRLRCMPTALGMSETAAKLPGRLGAGHAFCRACQGRAAAATLASPSSSVRGKKRRQRCPRSKNGSLEGAGCRFLVAAPATRRGRRLARGSLNLADKPAYNLAHSAACGKPVKSTFSFGWLPWRRCLRGLCRPAQLYSYLTGRRPALRRVGCAGMSWRGRTEKPRQQEQREENGAPLPPLGPLR